MGNTGSAKYWFFILKNPIILTNIKPFRCVIALKTEKIKQCNDCNQYMPISQFRNLKTGVYGVGQKCKICWSAWYKQRLTDDEYKKKLVTQRANNHIKNRDKYNKRHQIHFQKNKKYIYKRRKRYYTNNPDKAYAELHRQHIRNTLKCGKNALIYLGCDAKFLQKWFEFHFSINTNLSIENHGIEWHIDHVIPINKWDLTREDHRQLCFNWKNLMPLECCKNISKHDNIDMNQIREQNKRLQMFSNITGEIYEKLSLDLLYTAKPTIAGSS